MKYLLISAATSPHKTKTAPDVGTKTNSCQPVSKALRDQLCPHYPKCGDDDVDLDTNESGNVVEE